MVLLIVLTAVAGCRKPAPQAVLPPPPSPDDVPLHLDRPLTGLRVIKLWLGAEELNTEVCITPQQLATGMMFRTNMPENTAMLFPFAEPHQASFYMKNTTVPLTAAYIDPQGVILELHDLKPLDETGVSAATEQIQYVLEVNQGWFARHHVTTGAVVRTPQGALRQLFTRPR